MELMQMSIDRLTLLGEVSYDGMMDGLAHNPFVKMQKIAQYPYRYQWHMIDGSILQLADKNAGIPALRYEFNPNNWDREDMADRNPMGILKFFKECRISRIDIALDIAGINLAQRKITDLKSRTEALYKGRDKEIETYYFGTRRSPIFVRIYNKAREQGRENYPGHWWRCEAQINGELADAWDSIDPFEDLVITSGGRDLTEYDIRTKAMLHYLRQFPEAINELTAPVKRKYKELLMATASHEEIRLSELYNQNKNDLMQEVAMWKSLTQSDNIWDNINIKEGENEEPFYSPTFTAWLESLNIESA